VKLILSRKNNQTLTMPFNIPISNKPRIVIIGGGFAGFKFANRIDSRIYQTVLIDKNNYFQFQPLFYQVAMSGIEPSSICFPLRKNFRNKKDMFIRTLDITEIDPVNKVIYTDTGSLAYNVLIIATGSQTNYYGNLNFEKYTIPLKSVSEALYLRNCILNDLEQAVLSNDANAQERLMNIIIIGGGPTGVELAGALSEMKKHILPKDYPDLDASKMQIHLIQATSRLLDSMSQKASLKAYEDLEKMGVSIHLNTKVTNIHYEQLELSNGMFLNSQKIIWAAGVVGTPIKGLEAAHNAPGKKITVNPYCEVPIWKDVYALGDIAYMQTSKYPTGLPGLAPVALQQASYLAKRLNKSKLKDSRVFNYWDKGSMATIGRSKAVLQYKQLFLSGFIAWIGWLFVHIYYLIGVRNKLIVFINWLWNYIIYDQALRLNIKPKMPQSTKD